MDELDTFSDNHICILGLGYVGLTLAVAMADIGFKVVGVEIRDEVLEMLNNGEAHFHEPGLQERLRRVIQSGHLQCVKCIPENWPGSVFIITVGTPLDADGRSRLDMIENVGHEVAKCMQDGALVIMRSTVKLGVTRRIVTPILAASGKRFDLAFCPERTLEGKALVELRQLPQIVGGIDGQSALRASHLFQFITPTVIRVSSIESAEMIKLIDNAQRDVSFAYANEVARACDAIGVSAAEVIQAGKLGYPRTNLPMPGPVGGPCLEKDPHIFVESLRELGVELEITLTARRVNERQPEEIVNYLATVTRKTPGFATAPIITLMGIAFKGIPETDDLRGTMAKPTLSLLKERFTKGCFRGYDPIVIEEQIRCFGLQPVSNLTEAFAESSLVIILNNHLVFANMDISEFAGKMKKPGIIYDLWNHFSANDLRMPHGVKYIALGNHALFNAST